MLRRAGALLTLAILTLLYAAPADAAFNFYKTLNLTNSQAGSADSSNWPLAIMLDGNVQACDNDLKPFGSGGFVRSASGYDIRPYANDGVTALSYELVSYTSSGCLQMHVKIPTLNGSGTGTDTIIRLYFGDSSLTSDGSSASSTFSNSFAGVYHLEAASGSNETDSSGNGNTLTQTNSPTSATGQLGNARTFNGSTNYLANSSPSGAPTATPITISFWAKATDFGGYRDMVIATAYSGGTYQTVIGVAHVQSTAETFYFQNGSLRVANANTSGVWQHHVLVFDSTSASHYYRNGSAVTIDQPSGGYTLGPAYFVVGGLDGGINIFNGLVDEARIASAARTASWAAADYNSQKASSTFIVWGALTPIGTREPLTGLGK